MKNILFFDLEVDEKTKRIRDIGAVSGSHSFHHTSLQEFAVFGREADFLCGHNILAHDVKYLSDSPVADVFSSKALIDTLYLSALLFPEKPYHRLVKEYKLVSEEINNPLTDARLAAELFQDLLARFYQLPATMQAIYAGLLAGTREFSGFFRALDLASATGADSLADQIRAHFTDQLCRHAPLADLARNQPVVLAYALALTSTREVDSITPPWLLHTFPTLNEVLYLLRMHQCRDTHCRYCRQRLDPQPALRKYFRYEEFRRFSPDEEVSLQEQVVRSALDNQSLLAVFPTGGGKSLTFQLPALMTGEATRALTVVLSPLQSLMKDQVDGLQNRFEITSAVTINGMLSPLERSEAIERVASGGAHLLYLAPEALRSKVIFDLLLNRSIARFVIDEAHCFSAWGQDFRVDYLYIGEFIAQLQQAKRLEKPIPVSCFTATAKPQVVADICDYFAQKLSLQLRVFRSDARRVNLTYAVEEALSEGEKYQKLKNLLSQNDAPKIVYVARTRMAEKLAEALIMDGFTALPYHGQMDTKTKIRSQEAFMSGEANVMVATTAFGMGVDKDNVGMVIHYTISDSLENYVQEAGRAGRKPDLQASCYVLFDENDLNKHFSLLNQTKLNPGEIANLWKGIKSLTQYRSKVSKSALELAKAAGWDTEMLQLETRITSAIAALEEAGYVKRGQNSYRIFANSFLVKDVNQANEIIQRSANLLGKDKEHAVRIVQRIIKADETRVDYLSEILAIPKEDVMRVLQLLRKEGIIGDARDLTAFIETANSANHFSRRFARYARMEKHLLDHLPAHSGVIHLKEINEKLIESGVEGSSVDAIKDILNFWQIRHYIRKERLDKNLFAYALTFTQEPEQCREIIARRSRLAGGIVAYFSEKLRTLPPDEWTAGGKEKLLEFSVLELQRAIEQVPGLFDSGYSLNEYEEALLYLNAISALKLEGGFLILYKPLLIERIEPNRRKQFTEEDFRKLSAFYENKTQQIHIVGEYARKMLSSYGEALQFADDYFRLDYPEFLRKYFPNRTREISRPLTPARFREVFGSLSTEQLAIIRDEKSPHILVAAGPGSGKTRVLVHKVASLLLLEDTRPEQFLMLTFSRAAALEFKARLQRLVGNAAYYTDIHTYHSYCFNLLGRVGTLQKSQTVIGECIRHIQEGLIPESKIGNKRVLVVDEFQDLNAEESALLREIITRSEKLRVLVVGDDDQNIYEFRGSSVKYMAEFEEQYRAKRYELLTNFRSKSNLVAFANAFLPTISNRLKGLELVAATLENGRICLHRYRSPHLLRPLVANLGAKPLSGTTAVLTATNEEALLVESMLRQRGLPTRLIMHNEGFLLADLLEIKHFTDRLLASLPEEVQLISEEVWQAARADTEKQYRDSRNAWLLSAVLDNFELSYPRKLRYDWLDFLRESRPEDFYFPEQQRITVSTMHKAKGKEYDNVFVLLDHFPVRTDADRRVLYVAVTRARHFLSIHTNTGVFDQIRVSGMQVTYDDAAYTPPDELLLQLSHRDVYLSGFKRSAVSRWVHALLPGEPLLLADDGCTLTNRQGKKVLTFSRDFEKKLKDWADKGYRVKTSEVHFVVYWKDPTDASEHRIVLPQLILG